jgi:Protein of unknown function (DUF1566)
MRNSFIVLLLSVACLTSAWADSRFVIHDGDVFDSKTKLTWARCSVGQEWENQHCVGTISTFTFADAQKQANGAWRVPTKDELVSLIDSDQKNFPTIDNTAFPDMDPNHPWYWSSTPNGNTIAWYVDFTDGYISGFIDDVNTLAIRLVRSGP